MAAKRMLAIVTTVVMLTLVGAGHSAVARGGANPCASPAGDLDKDGLPNAWECGPVTLPEGELNLKKLGATPDHRDIFVECDFMKKPGKNLQPTQAALNMVATMFANAPLPNPDGVTGITIHIDAGSASVNIPAGVPRKGNRIPFKADWADDPFEDGGEFYPTKAANFQSARSYAFHYCVFASNYFPNGSSGLAFIPGADFIVTLGHPVWKPENASQWALWQGSTLAHELGPNLGLRHGAMDDVLWKPNYLSIMNYTFQFSGLIKNGSPGLMDYARFKAGSLNENRLVEANGIQGPAVLAKFATLWLCPDNSTVPTDTNVRNGVDWNCDGDLADTVKVNVNGDEDQFDAPIYGKLDVWNDWANLFYTGGPIGADDPSALVLSGPELSPIEARLLMLRLLQ